MAKNEWEWIDNIPTIKLRKEPSGKIRWLTEQEAARLIKELPPHLAAMAKFSVLTGLRASNVYNLKWGQINFEGKHAHIPANQSKSGRAISVPLVDQAIEVLKGELGKNKEYVFTFRKKPVQQVSTKAWYLALKRAKIKNFRWHDWRHTWASWHVQRGTGLHELQILGGWASYTMVLRYAHLTADHIRTAADKISGVNLVHHEKSSKRGKKK